MFLVITYLLEVYIYIHGEHSSKLWDQMTTTSIFLHTTDDDDDDDGGANSSSSYSSSCPLCVQKDTQRDRRNTERCVWRQQPF